MLSTLHALFFDLNPYMNYATETEMHFKIVTNWRKTKSDLFYVHNPNKIDPWWFVLEAGEVFHLWIQIIIVFDDI